MRDRVRDIDLAKCLQVRDGLVAWQTKMLADEPDYSEKVTGQPSVRIEVVKAGTFNTKVESEHPELSPLELNLSHDQKVHRLGSTDVYEINTI